MATTVKSILALLLMTVSCLAQGDVEDLMLLRVPSGPVVILGPDSITGLKLWLKPESLSLSNNGDQIYLWSDSSGNGSHVTQGVLGSRPYYTNSALGSYGGAYLDGVDDSWLLPSGSLGLHRNVSGSTIIIVVKKGYVSGEDYWYREYNGPGTAVRLAITQNGTTNLGLYTRTVDAGPTYNSSFYAVTTNNWNAEMYWNNFAGSNSVVYTNGVVVRDIAHGAAENTPDTDSAQAAISSGSALGWLSEVIIYNKALSSGERTTINTYLTNKYGVYPW